MRLWIDFQMVKSRQSVVKWGEHAPVEMQNSREGRRESVQVLRGVGRHGVAHSAIAMAEPPPGGQGPGMGCRARPGRAACECRAGQPGGAGWAGGALLLLPQGPVGPGLSAARLSPELSLSLFYLHFRAFHKVLHLVDNPGSFVEYSPTPMCKEDYARSMG